MDVLINIIIVIVVITTVLKRVQEVAQKGADVKKPASPLQGRPDMAPLPHVTGDASPEPAMAEPVSTGEKQAPEVRSVRDLFEYLQQDFKDAVEKPGRPEPAPEPQPAAMPAEFETEPAVPEMDYRSVSDPVFEAGMSRQKAQGISPLLTFSRKQVINGIILSEVLGPPVALRNEAGTGISF